MRGQGPHFSLLLGGNSRCNLRDEADDRYKWHAPSGMTQVTREGIWLDETWIHGEPHNKVSSSVIRNNLGSQEGCSIASCDSINTYLQIGPLKQRHSTHSTRRVLRWVQRAALKYKWGAQVHGEAEEGAPNVAHSHFSKGNAYQRF